MDNKKMVYLNIDSNLSEIITYNSPYTPIKSKITSESLYPNYRVPVHWHNEIELVYVLKGDLIYYINENSVPLKEGEGVLVNSGRMHFSTLGESEDCDYILVIFDTAILKSSDAMAEKFVYPLTFSKANDALKFTRDIPWKVECLELIKKVYEVTKPGEDNDPIRANIYINEFWNLLYKNGINKMNQYRTNIKTAPLKNMITYIQAHFAEKITLDDIAKAGMISKSKCNSLFQETLRLSPMNYLTHYRIRNSLKTLSDYDKSITEVAFLNGFNSASYYTETFGKVMNMSPKQYRSQYKFVSDTDHTNV